MTDCLLAYPVPTRDSPSKHPALSIFYLGAMLEQHGLEVEYFDARFDDFEKFVSLVRQNPSCVGISSLTGYQLIGAKKMFETVKQINPRMQTIFGGVHPSMVPEHCLREKNIDIVVVGEGEKTLFELVTALKEKGDLQKVNGIYWKNGGEIIKNETRKFMEPAEWPFPMTEKNKRYFQLSAQHNDMMMMSSRGCPFNCSFCYNLVFNRRKWRAMEVDQFKQGLDRFMEELKLRWVQICDDEFGANKERAKAIARVLQGFGLIWSADIRCDTLDEELARDFDTNGCHELLLGVESGSDRILKEIINKGYGVADVRKCAQILSKFRIHGRYNFMCGLPTETRSELHASLDLADWIHKTDKNGFISFDGFVPYPGTRLYEQALKTNFKEPQTLEEWSKMSLSNATVPVAQKLYYIAGLRFRKDKTSRNFPGLKRLLILPFEISGYLRWKTRFFAMFGLEKAMVSRLFFWASRKISVMQATPSAH